MIPYGGRKNFRLFPGLLCDQASLFHEFAVILHPFPLWKSIFNIHYTLFVKHMISAYLLETGFYVREMRNLLSGKVLSHIRAFEFDSGWVQQDLIVPFVHNRRMTIWASYLTGELVPGRFLHAVVPREVVVAIDEIYVLLFENSCPSKRRPSKLLAKERVFWVWISTMQSLTCSTMTVLRF